jgi:hypothetical protein
MLPQLPTLMHKLAGAWWLLAGEHMAHAHKRRTGAAALRT